MAFILRFYQVAEKPHDLYIDEVSIGYNAYSILKTGKDEYGIFLPLFFKSLGDYKLPVYVYLTALSEAVFGKNALAVRMPSVFFGSLTILFFILLIYEISRSERLSLLSGLYLAISPWHLQFSRAGFEANVALFFITSGIYLILHEFLSRKKTCMWGLLSLIISIYTYHVSRIFVPAILFTIFLFYKKEAMAAFKKNRWQKLIFVFILLLPFFIYSVSDSGLARFRQETLLKDLPKNLMHYPLKIFFWTINQIIINYLKYFSLDFLFFSGDQIGRHSVREMGMNYLWQLPFFLFGIYQMLKKLHRDSKIMLCWLACSPLAAISATPNPHALRGLVTVIPVTYLIVESINFFVKKMINRRQITKIILIPLTVYFMISYLHIYYVHYPRKASPDWNGGYKQAISYVKDEDFRYDQVILTPTFNRDYAFLLFYGNFPPAATDEYFKNRGLGKYHIYSSEDKINFKGKTLFFMMYYDGFDTDTARSKKIFLDQGGDKVFHIWEN